MSWFETPQKPESTVEYRSGFSCRKGHVQSVSWKQIATSGVEEVCKECGLTSRPAVIRRTFESYLVRFLGRKKWITDSFSSHTDEFVRYLDDPKDSISNEIVSKLKARAVRPMNDQIPPNELPTYSAGLQDGETITAQWLLEEIKQETK